MWCRPATGWPASGRDRERPVRHLRSAGLDATFRSLLAEARPGAGPLDRRRTARRSAARLPRAARLIRVLRRPRLGVGRRRRAISRTPSPRTASPTPCATRSCSPARCSTHPAAGGPSSTPSATTNAPVTGSPSRCSTSPSASRATSWDLAELRGLLTRAEPGDAARSRRTARARPTDDHAAWTGFDDDLVDGPTGNARSSRLSQVLGLSVWFSATAVVPSLRSEWGIGSTAAVWLTASVQIGFVAGAVTSTVVQPRRPRRDRSICSPQAAPGRRRVHGCTRRLRHTVSLRRSR